MIPRPLPAATDVQALRPSESDCGRAHSKQGLKRSLPLEGQASQAMNFLSVWPALRADTVGEPCSEALPTAGSHRPAETISVQGAARQCSNPGAVFRGCDPPRTFTAKDVQHPPRNKIHGTGFGGSE